MLNALLEAPFPGDAEELLHLRRQARQWLGELKVCERSRLQWLLIAENASRLQGVPRLSFIGCARCWTRPRSGWCLG